MKIEFTFSIKYYKIFEEEGVPVNKDSNKNNMLASMALNVISSVLNGTDCPSFAENFDWNSFVEFCSNHKILNIVLYGLKGCLLSLPEDVIKIYENNIGFSMIKEAQRAVEIDLLCDDFEKNCIPHMLMKGYVIKNLYPQPFLRSMSDIDILVGDNLKNVAEVMLKHGFTLKGEAFLHDIYTKNSLAVELHKSLIDESLDEYYSYFGTGFERAKTSEGFSYRYELSKEDFYIFLVTHMAKHYKINGTGIRSICDIYVYNKAYKNVLDYEYIFNELERLNLKKFEEKIRMLADEWFSDSFNGTFDAVGEYIISNGVHGNNDNHELNSFLLNEKKEKGKLAYIIRNIFPDMNYMCLRYEKLKKYPFFLPFYWIKRIISTIFSSRGSIRYRLKGVVESGKNDDERFKQTGLK